jgi:hypothetical protein
MCPDHIVDRIELKKGAAWYGEWDVEKQKKNEKRAKTILEGTTKTALWTVAPPVGLFFQAINDEPVSGADLAFAALPFGAGVGDDIARWLRRSAIEVS